MMNYTNEDFFEYRNVFNILFFRRIEEMVVYSHSRLTTFEQCPLKYKFKYIDELEPDYENSIEAFLGKKVHETLEWLYAHPQKAGVILDDAVAFYIAAWNSDFNEGIKIVKEDQSSEYYFPHIPIPVSAADKIHPKVYGTPFGLPPPNQGSLPSLR